VNIPNSDLMGKKLFHGGQIFEIFAPFGNGTAEWKMRSIEDPKAVFAIHVQEARLLAEEFTRKTAMDNDSGPITEEGLLDGKIREAVRIRSEENTTRFSVDLTDNELDFVLLWLATGIQQKELIKEINKGRNPD
jgi:hypothetical protein